MNKKACCLLLVSLGLGACAEQHTRSRALIPVEERYVPAAGVYSQDAAKPQPASVEAVEPTVIAALISDADSHAASGRTDKAIASIERALRIEPGNALLWHRFARIRLQQYDWQQAIALARKSNALTSNNDALKSANWEIIAEAYEAMGDKEKAREARKQQKLTG